MHVLWKCCKRTLQENKNRTIVTILGVALATGLITAVACLGVSLIASYTQYIKKTQGDAHVIFSAVSGKDIKRFLNNQSVEELWIARRDGYANTENHVISNTTNFIELQSVPEGWFDHHDNAVKLVKGRFPENENEIVLDRKLYTEVGMKLAIGDEITLAVGDRMLNGQKVRLGEAYDLLETIEPRFEKTYVIVGFTDAYNGSFDMKWRHIGHVYARTYRAYSYLSEDSLQKELDAANEDAYFDISLRYLQSAIKRQEELTAGLLGISVELYQKVWVNWETRPSGEELLAASEIAKDVEAKDGVFGLMRLESGKLINQKSYGMIFLIMLAFLILAYAGVFCINNSFDLTFTERVRFYGLMSSIGTTKRQRRELVLLEGVVIGAYGIPLGLLLGMLFTFVLVRITNFILSAMGTVQEFTMVFRVSFTALLVGTVVSALMIFLSAWESAVRASKVSPIAAIRSNEEVKSKQKKKGKPKRYRKNHFKRFLGTSGILAIRNYNRAKIKYRASVTSIALSITLFLGMSFVSMLYDQKKDEIMKETNCQLKVTVNDNENWKESFATLKKIVDATEGITRAEIGIHVYIMLNEEDVQWLPGKPDKDMALVNICFIDVLDEDSFAFLCKEAGLDYEEAKGKGIVNCSEVLSVPRPGAALLRDRVETGESFASYQKGDIIRGNQRLYTRIDDEGENGSQTKWEEHLIPTEIEVAGQADDVYALVDPNPSGAVMVYVDESWLTMHPEVSEMQSIYVEGCFLADHVNDLEETITDANIYGATTTNYDREYRQLQYIEILIKTFLISFMFIISMIGITNVINAIGTNMELRSQEFARLRSIGMTGGQLRHMVRAEMVILGGKGIIYGILIGTGVSYALYRFLWESSDKSYEFAFRLPILEAAICIVLVSLLLALITERRIRKMERRNIVETLRNENL